MVTTSVFSVAIDVVLVVCPAVGQVIALQSCNVVGAVELEAGLVACANACECKPVTAAIASSAWHK